MECGFDTYKNALIENLVILFVFFCAVEPIYSFFKPIGFFDLIKYNVKNMLSLCFEGAVYICISNILIQNK